ncbi:MAG: glycoside hydrolase family 88 protein [Bacteroidetes bacterium]|nr:glycoside hydrolase family 88 protein [Bacteroidota bacterium]
MRFQNFLISLLFIASLAVIESKAQQSGSNYSDPAAVLAIMDLVNQHFLNNEWKQNDRNWIRATYYTGLMAFYKTTADSSLRNQLLAWGQKHGWRIGTEWIYPANRLTCSQTYIQLYEIYSNANMIKNTREFMDKRVNQNKPAFEAGWDYVDALYVGTPAYFMMSKITLDPSYQSYAHRLFGEVTEALFDPDYQLYYRDLKAKTQKTESGLPEFWSRGNGWAFASIPRILNYLPEGDSLRNYYLHQFKAMATSLRTCQGGDGFWRSSLLDSISYPDPESSGTAFFVYGYAWGINQGILDQEVYIPVVIKAWQALAGAVDDDGKVCWGQDVARAPGKIDKEDSREFVSGAFLLAGSEVYKLISSDLILDHFKKE